VYGKESTPENEEQAVTPGGDLIDVNAEPIELNDLFISKKYSSAGKVQDV
jgi:hypothetical protein